MVTMRCRVAVMVSIFLLLRCYAKPENRIIWIYRLSHDNLITSFIRLCSMAGNSDTVWTTEHFIGGHPAVDLTNTVFTRHGPEADNDLLNSPRDVGNWLRFAGLATTVQANAVSAIPSPSFLRNVRALREASFAVFDAMAAERPPAPEALGFLLARAAEGFSTHKLTPRETYSASEIAHF